MDFCASHVLITLMGIGCVLIGFCLATIIYHCNGIQQQHELIEVESSITNNKSIDSSHNKLEIVTI